MGKPLKLLSTHQSHETIFVERYARLCHWSLRLTENDRERAEDLVHDLYIQFVHLQPDLSTIQNLDGYLYRTLQNLNISQLRRRGPQQSQQLSVVDYDSAETSLRSADPRELIRYQDDLRQVCHYAATRKESSKAGSALILRFVHGYYPREIALVMRCTREAVEERLRVARVEARQYLQDPQQLRFLRRTAEIKAPQTGFVRPVDQLLTDLRQQIFDSRQGTCRPIKPLYNETGNLEIATLAHLVSCPECLDEVNRLLELPPLAERFPTDSLGNDQPAKKRKRSGDDDGPGSGISATDLESLKRRAEETFARQPQSLCVAVNGDVVAEQSINSERCSLLLNLKEIDDVHFVEILSDQQTLLLLISVTEGTPQKLINRTITLSEGRTIDVTVDLEAPKVEVTYQVARDPNITLVQSQRNWLGQLLKWLNPATATATIAVILIAVLLFVRSNVTAVNAKDLLARASVAERVLSAPPGIVVHRTIRFETRRAGVAVQQRIEIWRQAESTLRRLYDATGKLIAAESINSNGSSMIYRLGATPESRTSSIPQAVEAGELWRLDPSVNNLTSFVANPESLTVKDEAGGYILEFHSSETKDGVTNTTLRLDRVSGRPMEQTLTVVKQGTTHDYHFVEVGLEQKSLDLVPPSVFQPESELAGTSIGPAEVDSRTNSVPPSTEVMASPELEIEVTYLLNRIRADLGEQVTLSRTGRGLLRVEAVTETEQRKSEILRALSPVQHNPAVQISVRTADEAARGSQANAREIEEDEIGIASTASPADVELRRYFAQRVASDDVDEEIRRYSERVMGQSRLALLRAAALQKLVQRFSAADVEKLEPSARAKWLAMVREQAVGCQSSIAAVRAELRRVFPGSSSGGSADAKDLRSAADQLLKLSYANDDMVRRAFTVSADGRGHSLLRPEFWKSLDAAEEIAREIAFL